MGIITQLCGICICLVLAVFYKQQRKLNLETQNAFVKVWKMVFMGLMLDIASFFILKNEEVVPTFLSIIVCNAYLLTILWEQVLEVLYIDTYISENHEFKQKETLSYLVYGIVGSVMIFAMPIRGIVDLGRGNTSYGQATIVASVLALILLVRMILLIIIHRRQMTKNSIISAFVWIGLCLASTIIQFLNADWTIVGFFSALGIMIIYLRLENPERFVDSNTGFFNSHAFRRCTEQLDSTGEGVAMLYLTYEQMGYQVAVVDREIRLKVCNFIDKIKNIYPFRGVEEGVIIVVRKPNDVLSVINTINKRFDKPWGKNKDIYLKHRILYLEDTSMLKSAFDAKKIFHYVCVDKELNEEEGLLLVDETIIQEAYKEEDVEKMIQESIRNQRVEVFYQPIYSTASKTYESAEALIRIRREDGSIVMPGEFIEIAEKRGSILQLGASVFDEVCRFIEEHDMEAMGLHYIEVNLSAVQCSYKNLAQELIETMKRHHVDPHYINLEITESAAMGNEKVFLDNLYALKNYGVSFSLDDFGTGQSNLNYIVAMPVDIVKFDRGMTLSYFENAKAKYVMDAAMMMIKGMDLQIVSEGIENKEQLEIMEALGIQYIQGYYFSKPLPKGKFLEIIAAPVVYK